MISHPVSQPRERIREEIEDEYERGKGTCKEEYVGSVVLAYRCKPRCRAGLK